MRKVIHKSVSLQLLAYKNLNNFNSLCCMKPYNIKGTAIYQTYMACSRVSTGRYWHSTIYSHMVISCNKLVITRACHMPHGRYLHSSDVKAVTTQYAAAASLFMFPYS